MAEQLTGIRLDYLSKIMTAITEDDELESILGSPLERHIALVVKDGRFQFNVITPFGEGERDYGDEDKVRAQQIVTSIIKSNYPGTEGLPGVR
ncbi:MAG: hypothetical protein ABIH11_09025 [Candidatus Altiarchaeota archaeon]